MAVMVYLLIEGERKHHFSTENMEKTLANTMADIFIEGIGAQKIYPLMLVAGIRQPDLSGLSQGSTSVGGFIMGGGKMTDLKRWAELKKKLFGDDMFVEVDTSNPDWIEYNELTKKVIQAMAA